MTRPGETMEGPEAPAPVKRGKMAASSLVATGIFLSRIAGLIRERVFGHFFGTSMYADVFRAALRMPNALQNLLGEGTLSASFIPVYSELLEEGKEEEAGRVAGAIFAILMVVAAALALFGILLAPVLVSVFLPGFEGEQRDLTITATRVIFPMAGTLVLSAWALGILNSHRKFFISYVAPVIWNAAMIGTLLLLGDRLTLDRLVIALTWGALLGGILQLGVQLPYVLRLERGLVLSFGRKLSGVRTTLKNAGPAILGRGVVQISGYIDYFLASFLAAGAVASIGYAQTLYILPVSLFGMSVAASELPELSRQRSSTSEVLRLRTNRALQRIAFYVVPSFVGYVLLGDVIIAALYQTGEFGSNDTLLVHLTLIGFSLGLLASTATRLFSSTFFALRDTRTPARFAALRVGVSAVLAFLLMWQFEPLPEFGMSGGLFSGVRVDGRSLGVVGLALGSGIAAWVEWGMLRRTLSRRIGPVGAGAGAIGKMMLAALLAAGSGWLVRYGLVAVDVSLHPILDALLIFGVFGPVYFGVAALLGLDEVKGIGTRLGSVLRRR